jgi:hypothetical protein
MPHLLPGTVVKIKRSYHIGKHRQITFKQGALLVVSYGLGSVARCYGCVDMKRRDRVAVLSESDLEFIDDSRCDLFETDKPSFKKYFKDIVALHEL